METNKIGDLWTILAKGWCFSSPSLFISLCPFLQRSWHLRFLFTIIFSIFQGYRKYYYTDLSHVALNLSFFCPSIYVSNKCNSRLKSVCKSVLSEKHVFLFQCPEQCILYHYFDISRAILADYKNLVTQTRKWTMPVRSRSSANEPWRVSSGMIEHSNAQAKDE